MSMAAPRIINGAAPPYRACTSPRWSASVRLPFSPVPCPAGVRLGLTARWQVKACSCEDTWAQPTAMGMEGPPYGGPARLSQRLAKRTSERRGCKRALSEDKTGPQIPYAQGDGPNLQLVASFAQFISMCRWVQLIRKERLARHENAPFFTQ